MRRRIVLATLVILIEALPFGGSAFGQDVILDGTGAVQNRQLPPEADIDGGAPIESRSYRMACVVSVGSCPVDADKSGLSCYCNGHDGKNHRQRIWGHTAAPRSDK